MSSSTFDQTRTPAIRHSERSTQLPVVANRKWFKIGRPDLAMLLAVMTVVLLLTGFGIVAVPLAVHDLPLLLG